MSESLTDRIQYFKNKNLSILVRALVSEVSRLGDDFITLTSTWVDSSGVWRSAIIHKDKTLPCTYEEPCECVCDDHECHRGLPDEASCGI
jgi:hypothetical protein